MSALKLNLGCGTRQLDGYLNVDMSPECNPDQVVDLEDLPWPFEDDSTEQIIMSHVLEHLGADSKTFLGIMSELYRICRNGALIQVVVPHPRHDDFMIDPTHVRPILPEMFQLFSKKRNLAWQESGAANTPLALYTGTDFEIERINYQLDEPWLGLLSRGEIQKAELDVAIRSQFNVVKHIEILLKVVKE